MNDGISAPGICASAPLVRIIRAPTSALWLPAYSPDLMPVEHLWKWLRHEVTYNDCPLSLDELVERVAAFEARLQAEPEAVARRLPVRT